MQEIFFVFKIMIQLKHSRAQERIVADDEIHLMPLMTTLMIHEMSRDEEKMRKGYAMKQKQRAMS